MQTTTTARKARGRPGSGGSVLMLLLCVLMLSAAIAGYYLMDSYAPWPMPTQPDHITLNFRR